MESVLDFVKNGLLFGIFGSVILMLAPNKSYQKHISFVVGLLFILVMIHPVMTFFSMDEETYRSTFEHFFDMEYYGEKQYGKDMELYQKTLQLQLKAVLMDAGYNLKDIEINIDDSGNVYEVHIRFDEPADDVQGIEQYMKETFGEEVVVCYEY